MPTSKVINEHYSNKYKQGNYQLLREYAQFYLKVYQGIMENIVLYYSSLGDSVQGKKVLDIGTFTGEFLGLLRREGADVYGIELQQEAVKVANRKLKGRVKCADVMSSEFKEKDFDIISMLGLLEHVTNPISLIKRTHKLLRKEGILVIQTPNSGSFIARTLGKFWPPYSPVEHIHLFSRRSIERALESNGYKVVRFTPHWKFLPLGYVYKMFQNFGPEFYRILKPFNYIFQRYNIISLPFYVGEMIIIAKKQN